MIPTLLGLAGKARTGKGTFFNILSDIIYAQDQRRVWEVAYAHALKEEIDDHLIKTYGISAWTVNDAHKKIIRPELVKLGAGRRAEDPDHWVKIVAPYVKASLATNQVVILTDNRYANEANWIHSLGGKIVYIERILPDGSIQPPANEEEAVNDPQVRACADITLSWPTLPLDQLRPYVADVWRQLNSVAV